MNQASGLLARLNTETRIAHAAVDGAWLSLLRPTVTISEYCNQLVRTYGLVAPFESACKYTPGLARLLDGRQLTRSGLIAQDLIALDLSASQIATIRYCPTIDMFRSVAEALGWLYVIERTALIADDVRKHLDSCLPQAAKASSYLAAFEGQAGQRLQTFGRVLDRVAASDKSATAEIVDSAHQAFDVARSWFRTIPFETRSVG